MKRRSFIRSILVAGAFPSIFIPPPRTLGSIDFNGTSGYMTSGTLGSPVTGYPATLACWFNADSITVTGVPFALCVGTASQAALRLQAAGATGGDPIQATSITNTGTTASASSSAGYAAGTWYHACCVFTSATSRAAFRDGASKGTNSTNIVLGATLDRVIIGARITSGAVGGYFDGRVAQCSVWNVALNDDEVLQLGKRANPRRIRPSNLVFHAPLPNAVVGVIHADFIGRRTLTENSVNTHASYPPVNGY